MTSAQIELIFEGDAFRNGTVDARVLAKALVSYSDAFQRSNEMVNGDASEASVRVETEFRAASYHVPLQLVQEVVGQAKSLITGFEFKTAVELALLLGLIWKKDSLIALLRWLKGQKPDVMEKNPDGSFSFVVGQQKMQVSNTVVNLYGDEVIRSALASGVELLQQEGVEKITFRPKIEGAEPTTIEKKEVEYFKAEPLELQSDDVPREGDRDAVLTIAKLAFQEGTKWSFIESGTTLSAEITDEAFFKRVHQRRVKFAEGDQLRVTLHWKMVDTGKRPFAENTITKVHKVIQKPEQLRLKTGSEKG